MAELNGHMVAMELCLQFEQMKLDDEKAEEAMITIMAYFMRALVKNRMCFEKVISAVEHVYNQKHFVKGVVQIFLIFFKFSF